MNSNTYWTPEKTESLVRFVKQGCSLIELQETFPVKSSMSIIFALRSVSLLGATTTLNESAKEKVRDQRLSKREAFPDSNLKWEDWDCSRLRSYFLQPMSIEDVHLSLGRSYTSIFKQMEKMYPRPMDRQKLFEEVSLYVRFKPIQKSNPSELSLGDNGILGSTETPIIKNESLPKESSNSVVCFDNIESRIISELNSARWSIKVAVAWITNNAISDIIKSKLEAGLDVSVVLNKDKINCGKGAIDFEGMCENGLSLHWVTNLKESLMHEKFCIIDNECLIVGTYNWTNKAEQRNDENIIIIKNDEALITSFIEHFDYLKEKYPVQDVEKSAIWKDKNKALKEAYAEYLLNLRKEKEQKDLESVASNPKRKIKRSKPIPPTNTWKEYYSRPWSTDDEALLLHYYYKEKLSVGVLSSILKRTNAELLRHLEDLKQEAFLMGLTRKKK